MYINTYIHTHTHTYTHTHTHTQSHAQSHTITHTHTISHTHTQYPFSETLVFILSHAEHSPVPPHWRVPPSCVTLVTRCLQRGEDDVVMHYAAKVLSRFQ